MQASSTWITERPRVNSSLRGTEIRLTLDPAPRVGWTGTTENHQAAIAMFDRSSSSETWPTVSVPVAEGAVPAIPARVRGSRKVVNPPGRILTMDRATA